MRHNNRITGKYQAGITTLAITMLLLLLITIVSLSVARTGVTEQQISGNFYRERQAFAAAQAGLSTAVANLEWSHLNSLPPSTTIMGGSGALGSGATYTYTYRLFETASGIPLVELVAEGKAGDGSGNKILWQTARFAPPLVKQPDTPLTGRASVRLSGALLNSSIGAPLIRAGGSITHTPPPPGQGCSTPGLCPSDTTIGKLTETEFFSSYFGADKKTFSRLGAHYSCDLCEGTADGQGSVIIQINNRQGAPIHLRNTTLGTLDDPVILLIDGNVHELSQVTLHGLLYTMGEIDAVADDVKIHGALMAEKDITLQGSLVLVYDTFILDKLISLGRFHMIPGTWRDF